MVVEHLAWGLPLTAWLSGLLLRPLPAALLPRGLPTST